MSERKLIITENNNKKQNNSSNSKKQQKCHCVSLNSDHNFQYDRLLLKTELHAKDTSTCFVLVSLSLFILQFCPPVSLAEQFVFLPCRQTTSRRVLSSCHCIAVILYGEESEPVGSFYPHPEPGDWLDRIIREDVSLSQIFLLFKLLLFFSLFISVTEERITVLVWRICEQYSCQ